MERQRHYISANLAPSRARRLGIAATAIGLVALALSAGVVASSTSHGVSVGDEVTAIAHDPSSVFAKRSPGHRGLGELLQTKLPALAKSFVDRAIPKGAPKIPVDAPAPDAPPAVDQSTPVAVIEAPGPFAEDAVGLDLPVIQSLSDSMPQVIGGGPGGSEGPLSVGGPGGGGGGGGGGVYPELLSSPVPEPATWATMIVGFFSIGLAIRVRARRERRAIHGAGA